MGRAEGKRAIVTGAGMGIGRAVARSLAREGARVLVAERNERAGREVVAEICDELGGEAEFLRTDVGVKEDVLAMVAHAIDGMGGADILVNNAWGGGSTERLERKSDENMEHGFRIGLMSSFWAMQAVFPYMRDQGWGRIVNICSLNGVNAHMYTVEYNTSKEALRTLTRTAAREWARHGICANAVCPAAATTSYAAFVKASPENAAKLVEENPMQRIGDAEKDVAPVVIFLASEDARYLTGNTLFVDGGSHINGVAWAPNLPE